MFSIKCVHMFRRARCSNCARRFGERGLCWLAVQEEAIAL
jgi:hypothetical protein